MEEQQKIAAHTLLHSHHMSCTIGKSLYELSNLILTTTLDISYRFIAHFRDEKTEAQRRQVMFPVFHS